MSNAKDWPSLEVVIPVYNEDDVLELLISRLSSVFAAQNLCEQRVRSVGFIMVDDGSRDRTAEIICRHIEAGFPAVLYRLSRNFGHQNALSAGLDYAEADLVAIIDADLQDPPELIYDMLKKWREGYDVIYGQRQRRKEGLPKRVGYWLFYRMLSVLSEIPMPFDSGDFCLLDRRVVNALRDLPEKLRFVRGLRAWVGFRQAAFPYERATRQAGRPKYTWRKLYRLATDGIASSSVRPLKIAQLTSFCFFCLSLAFLLLLALSFLFWRANGVSPYFLLAYALLALGNSLQALCIYVLGAYVGRSYLEVKKRPSYLITEVIGRRPDDAKNVPRDERQERNDG